MCLAQQILFSDKSSASFVSLLPPKFLNSWPSVTHSYQMKKEKNMGDSRSHKTVATEQPKNAEPALNCRALLLGHSYVTEPEALFC